MPWTAQRIIRELERPRADRRPLMRRIQAEVSTGVLCSALMLTENKHTRLLVTTIVARRCDPAAIDTLLGVSDDSDDAVRQEVAYAIGKIFGYVADPPPEHERGRVLSHLLTWWKTETYSGARSMLAQTLALIGDRSAYPVLVAAASDDDPSVRRQAMWLLARLDSRSVQQPRVRSDCCDHGRNGRSGDN